jgi:hypothetical protein
MGMLALGASSCRVFSVAPAEATSRPEVIRGENVGATHPEVVFLALAHAPAMCTGVAVGHNAVLTASHCVMNNQLPTDVAFVEGNPVDRSTWEQDGVPGIRSVATFVTGESKAFWSSSRVATGLLSRDLAVVMFPDFTFLDWAEVASSPLKVDPKTEVAFVGYGLGTIPDKPSKELPAKFFKERGVNVLAGRFNDIYSVVAPRWAEVLLRYNSATRRDEKTDSTRVPRSGLAPGDSGCPLYRWPIEGRPVVYGTWVGWLPTKTPGIVRDIFTDLLSKNSRATLRLAIAAGARIEGFERSDDRLIDLGEFFPDEALQNREALPALKRD